MNNDYTGSTTSYFIVKKDWEVFNPQRISGLNFYNVESAQEATAYEDVEKARQLIAILAQFASFQGINVEFEVRKNDQTLSIVE